MTDLAINERGEGLEIAIIGMSGRFPGAENLDRFWRNLRDGVESIRRFTDEELTRFGVDPESLRDPSYVKAGAILQGIDLFDAEFFGYSPREAELIDPQQRIFLECAWHAMEDAGYGSGGHRNLVGVFAGTSLSTYLLDNLLADPEAASDTFQAMIGNDKDFLSTRVSYELNLRGPSLTIQTACSTSLVAVHMASQSLLSYQCDMALAGGVSIQVPQRTGYRFVPGGISSPDGSCRAFDARAQGTVFGSGVGVVALKRLADALSDGDTIHAVIRGSAVSNDGSSKIGYTAPSIEGQAQAIAMAQIIAGICAESITYVETHGTGTALGDPAEIEALTKAFRASTGRKNFCAIGSVKSNIGHLDAAAGIAGLIKTVLALKHRQLPASLHYEQPNPQIDFAESPFYVNSRLREWRSPGGKLRAGVSSFGVGGANAHVVLEEAPPAPKSSPSRPCHLLLLSARTESALDTMTDNLATHLKQREEIKLADVAYTLGIGRKVFNFRRVIIGRDRDDVLAALERGDSRVLTAYQEADEQSVVFMFPGGGAQYVNMAAGLYEHLPVFREQIDHCSELLGPEAQYDLRDRLFPQKAEAATAVERMKQASVGLPALFAVEYALARLWMSWGVQPQAMVGHSVGQYVAACLAGVFSLEDALSMVLLRGRLFERLPRGAMLGVPLPESELSALIGGEMSIASINGPSNCVVSGPVEEIEEMERSLAARAIDCRRLQIDVAAHSPMVEEILPEFASLAERIEFHAPTIPFISNESGRWITPDEANDPRYWVRHLRRTVRFADGIAELMQEPRRVLLEVGPGQTLSSLAKMQAPDDRRSAIISSMRHPHDDQTDLEALLAAAGRLWFSNVRINWYKFYEPERRARVPLPTYPFERQRYWIDPRHRRKAVRSAERKKPNQADWIYVPLWKQSPPVVGGNAGNRTEQEHCTLFFADELGVAESLAAATTSQGSSAVVVRSGFQFSRAVQYKYTIDPRRRGDYSAMLDDLLDRGMKIRRIVHAWSIAPEGPARSEEEEFFAQCQDQGFYSLLFLAQALAEKSICDSVQIYVLSSDMHEVTGHEDPSPSRATALALCAVIPQEYPNIRCRSIDLASCELAAFARSGLREALMAELSSLNHETAVAYRRGRRWIQVFENLPVSEGVGPKRRLRDGGVYLITGGLGRIGMALSEYLAREARAKLVLTGRSELPARSSWVDWLASHADCDPVSLKVRWLQAIERNGAEVLYLRADAADLGEMRNALAVARARFGEINGVVHAAGIAGEGAIRAISQLDRGECERQFRPKVKGLFVIEKIMRGKDLDFYVLTSSIASLLGGIGHAAYSAANLFMEAFSRRRNRYGGSPWLCLDWELWRFAGPGEQTFSYKGNASFGATVADLAISSEEGVRVFADLLNRNASGRVLISTADLQARIDQWIRLESINQENNAVAAISAHRRPALSTKYIAPGSERERTVARIWQEVLGIEKIGVQDNFFELGGNSLLGLKVISSLKKELGADVPVVALFEGPTVRTLAAILSRKSDEPRDYDKIRRRGEERRAQRRRGLSDEK
jgi:acyl transferase domain-containing protein